MYQPEPRKEVTMSGKEKIALTHFAKSAG